MAIKLALAGNPNSGKTTMFNELTGSQQYVGNWPGVTVEKKEGKLKGHKDVVIVDLPGIYSLSPYTLEEVVSREYLLNDSPDAIINIVDATNIERNLYLTTQLVELGIPTVIALNMMDIVGKRGDDINIKELEKHIGCPVVETSALKGSGTKEVIKIALELAETNKKAVPMHQFSKEVETVLDNIAKEIEDYVPAENLRWYSIKFFERDKETLKNVDVPADILERIEKISLELEDKEDDDSESIITNERYKYIGSIIKGNVKKVETGKVSTSDKIDRIVTHPILALPIFAVIMFLVYFLAISTVGTGLTDWVNDGLFGDIIYNGLSNLLTSWNANAIVMSLVLDGIVAGVGAVLGFLPQMMVLFFLLAILEDSGYMARIAFIMDKIFRRFGLSGKSFIPMLITTGCGVPGIMATRTIESERDRKMTVMTTTFVPCSAKLPIIALIAGALFPHSWWVAPSVYFIGIGAVIVSGIILKKTKMFSGDPAPFVMELPPYRVPGIKGLLLHMWDKAKSFVKRAGSVIFVSAVVIWFLSNFNLKMQMVDTDSSILAMIGGLIAPLFKPLGWGSWQAAVASITGFVAKENVVGTFGVLFGFGDAIAEDGAEIWGTLATHFTALAGYSFLIFNMLCAPCFAAIGAMKKELGTKWMWIIIGYQTAFAYLVSLVIYQLGLFIQTGVFGIGTAVAIVVVFGALYLLFRPTPKHKSNTEAKLHA